MEVRPGANPADVKNYDTDRLRHDFLIQNLFVADEIKTIYSQIDRIIVGAATPVAPLAGVTFVTQPGGLAFAVLKLNSEQPVAEPTEFLETTLQ